MHCFPHLSVSSEATVYLAAMVLTTGVYNLHCHTQSRNVFFLTFVYCYVVFITQI